jgi:membrane protease YdiL (CAAX protease family)
MLNRIIGVIGWLGFAAVLVAVGIRFGYPAKDQYATYAAYAGLVCLLIYILGQWRDIAKLFTRRQARYGTLTGVSVVVVLGILIAINYIGARQNKRWDLTANKQFSLSDQTRNVLQKLDAPLRVRVFTDEAAFQQYKDKLNEYSYASKNVATE